jgi:hypothetical protein
MKNEKNKQNTPPLIVCLYGGIYNQTGVGKTTAAGFLSKNFDFHICHIGQGVETVAKQTVGWNGKKDKDGIEILNNVCASGRKISPLYWLNMAFLSIPESTKRIVIDDLWFTEEYHVLKNMKSFFILVERSDFNQTSWDFDFDFAINNDEDIKSFEQKIELTINEVVKTYEENNKESNE